ncbi:Bis(5'-adenosyl)-triphosphatase enpp4 [Blattella germanica]|nr:Bis(5'-adenosyl)-triphosphatase enpp4 [Blattella germanica]
MDNLTGYIVKKLDEHNLTNAVNVFLLSDHGFETVAVSRIINITDFIPPEAKYTIVEASPTYHIYPAEGDEDIIYNALKNASRDHGHFSVFRKHEILDRWYYKNNRRAPPIFVLADESYAFNDMHKYAVEYTTVTNAPKNSTFGIHGYDNNVMNMHPFFMAFGPQIKKEFKLDPFDNVDLYSLFCYMLKLTPPHNNGTLENVKSLLSSEPDPSLPYIRK